MVAYEVIALVLRTRNINAKPVSEQHILTSAIFPRSRLSVLSVRHGDIDIVLTTCDVRHWGTVD